MSVRVLLLLLFFTTLLNAKCCKNFSNITLESGLERNRLSGFINIKDDDRERFDFRKDLNLKKTKNALAALLFKNTQKHSFSFKVNHYKYQGSNKLTQNIVSNSLYNATAKMVKNELDLKWAKGSYRYRYTQNLSIGADLHGLRLHTLVEGKEYKKALLLPAVGVDYNFDLADDLKVVTKTTGTFTPKNRYFSQYLGLSFDLGLSNCTALNVGYQYKNLYLDTDKYKSDLKFSGLYAGIAMRF